MSKSSITRLFAGSLIAIVGGVVLVVAGGLFAFANNAFVMDGPDVTGVHSSAFAWSMVGLATIGIIAMVGGVIGQFIAWIGAVLNTFRLDDKTWFILMLVLGLLTFGFIAMLLYVFIGPDGTRIAPRQTQAVSGTVG